MIHVDQSPIGRTPRSNPATYTGVFDHIRKLFASTPEAKMRGYLQGRFSFNVKGGRCEACSGDGTIKIEMNFLPDVYVPCEVCHGARYNRETLEVHYKGKTIAEVLDMPIEEAADFFAAVPAISRHLETLVRGRPRLRPARPAGHHPVRRRGAAGQAVVASCRSARPAAPSTSSTSRPPACTSRTSASCCGVLGRLVDKGNTVLVIEHNLDVIKTADWLIDMGPEGGSRGGMVVAEGTPEEVAGRRRQPHRPRSSSRCSRVARPTQPKRQAAPQPRGAGQEGRHRSSGEQAAKKPPPAQEGRAPASKADEALVPMDDSGLLSGRFAYGRQPDPVPRRKGRLA